MQNALRYLLVYIAWIVLAALGFWLLFLVRGNLLDLLTILLEDPTTSRDSWIARALDKWFLLLGGGAWLVCIMLLEGYFRNSVERELMAYRIGRTFLIVGVLTGVSYLLRWVF